MPKSIIEDMRKGLMSSEYYRTTIRKKNLKKFEEEKHMPNNPFTPPTPPTGGPVAPMVPGMAPMAPMAPMGGAPMPTNINKLKEDTIQAAIKRSLTFRPLALITDGAEIYRFAFDKNNSELVNFISNWRRENVKEDKATGQMVPKSINLIRAVKELCILKPGASPQDFAEYGEDGQPKLELKKPAIKGFVVKFPRTETSGEFVDIIKKANLADAIAKQGGFSLAGNYMESSIDAEKLEIPIALSLTPTKRQVKDRGGRAESKAILRISGSMTKDLQKSLFPGKNNVGLYDMFNSVPFGNYKFKRIVPLKLYKTQTVSGKEVGILNLDPEKKLAQYESYENPLTDGRYGKDLMEAVGKTAAELQATFARKAGGSANESEADLMRLIMDAYLGSDSDPTIAERYVNNFMQLR